MLQRRYRLLCGRGRGRPCRRCGGMDCRFPPEGEPPLNTEGPETPRTADRQPDCSAEKGQRTSCTCMFDPKGHRSSRPRSDLLSHPQGLSGRLSRSQDSGNRGIPVAAQIRSVTDDTLWSCTEQVTIPAEGTTTAVRLHDAISAAAGNADTHCHGGGRMGHGNQRRRRSD